MIGDALYMVGFWAEYAIICAARKVARIGKAVWSNFTALLFMIARPFLLGLITIYEDLTAPFVRVFSGAKHIRQLSDILPVESPEELRAEQVAYLKRGTKRYWRILWTVLTYLLPIAGAAGLFFVVRTGLGFHFILSVQVNGETVGYVETEQMFENAREDVQARIENAKNMLLEAGSEVPDSQWDIQPTYTLALGGQTMTESEITNAILRTSGDEITNGTAVYIDGQLRFVTTEGDHLRTFLERIKAPYINSADPSIRVSFVHDIRLLDGVFLKDSIMPYTEVVNALNEGNEILTYTAQEGDTVLSVVQNTGVSFDSLAALNPAYQALDQQVPAGTELITGVQSAELLKVKVVIRHSYPQDIPYETQSSESSEYDFGKTVVVQEGEVGLQEITQDDTYIDNVLLDSAVVNINVVKQPVPRVIIKGTRLKDNMVAKIGSGTFIWPVPGYRYVSRWMSAGHRGADICAPYGTPIYAMDSGVVTSAYYHYSWGNHVVIDHGNGYTTLYGHMSTIAVSQGQAVTQGQVIGYVGSTGNSTGNHCHLEMALNGRLFSARSLFPGM